LYPSWSPSARTRLLQRTLFSRWIHRSTAVTGDAFVHSHIAHHTSHTRALSRPHARMLADSHPRSGHLALLRQRFDPILSSGEVSSHVHSIVGASAFTSDMTFASAQTSSCTTAYVQDDKSGVSGRRWRTRDNTGSRVVADSLRQYWAPQLFYKFTNGTYVPIQTSGASTYWYVIVGRSQTWRRGLLVERPSDEDEVEESRPVAVAVCRGCRSRIQARTG
jgi:hypothetical protein